MKEISHTILSFLKTNYPRAIRHKPFSAKTNKLLSRLFSLFSAGEVLYREPTFITKEFLTTIHEVDSYVPEGIQKLIRQQNQQTTILFYIGTRKYTICMYHSDGASRKLIQQHIKRIFIWLYTASQFANSKCSQSLKINLYFTNAKKYLPDKQGSPIERNHANTAFTTSCKSETEINIFREEEWFKVFIHETFHCMGLDFSGMENNAPDELILKLFHLKSDVRLYETYCETWAETLNVMFISYLSSRSKNIDKMIEKTEQLLYYEKMFSLFQCAKVLDHFHLTYDDVIEKKNKALVNYKEKTQILSYYVIKSICLFYVNDYIEWCVDNNGETLNFNKTNKNVSSYVGFIQSHYVQNEFRTALNRFENNRGNSPPILENTLRMSLFEIL